MNTREEYKTYYAGLLAASNIDVGVNKDSYVNGAIDAGIKQFWGANNWTFKEAYDPLVLGSSAESYDVPDDFEGIKSARETTSNRGLRLRYIPKEKYDSILPKLSTITATNPVYWTMYTDGSSKRKKIQFLPQSTAQTIEIIYLRTTPEEPTQIPDKFQSGLMAAIAWHIYPHTEARLRQQAYDDFIKELKRLQVIDKYDMSEYNEMGDDTSDSSFNSDFIGNW